MSKTDLEYNEKETQQQCRDAIVNALISYKDELPSDTLTVLMMLTKTTGHSIRDAFVVFADALVRYTSTANNPESPTYVYRDYTNQLYWAVLEGETLGYVRLLLITQAVVNFASTGSVLARALNEVSVYPHYDESMTDLYSSVTHVIQKVVKRS